MSGAGPAFVAPGWSGAPPKSTVRAGGQPGPDPVAPPAGGLTEADVFAGMRKGLVMRAEAAENDALVLELGARAKRSDAAVLRTAAGKVGDLLDDVPVRMLTAGLGGAVDSGGGAGDSAGLGVDSGNVRPDLVPREMVPRDSGRDSGAAA